MQRDGSKTLSQIRTRPFMAAEFIKDKIGNVKKIGIERPMFPYDRMLFLQGPIRQ